MSLLDKLIALLPRAAPTAATPPRALTGIKPAHLSDAPCRLSSPDPHVAEVWRRWQLAHETAPDLTWPGLLAILHHDERALRGRLSSLEAELARLRALPRYRP